MLPLLLLKTFLPMDSERFYPMLLVSVVDWSLSLMRELRIVTISELPWIGLRMD